MEYIGKHISQFFRSRIQLEINFSDPITYNDSEKEIRKEIFFPEDEANSTEANDDEDYTYNLSLDDEVYTYNHSLYDEDEEFNFYSDEDYLYNEEDYIYDGESPAPPEELY